MWQEQSVATIAIVDLFPTQVTIGMREVDVKRQWWREETRKRSVGILKAGCIPAILGPENRCYIIDRHHLTRALYEEGIDEVTVTILANWAGLPHNAFWSALECHGWTHPFDDENRRCDYHDIPRSVLALIDDPFRSLSGALKRAGGYSKQKAPFSEFRWADFLRFKIEREMIERDFDSALALAMKLALSGEAIELPGWLGSEQHRLENGYSEPNQKLSNRSPLASGAAYPPSV
jgi:hypothetical protein